MTSRERYAFKGNNRYMIGPISRGINRLSRATEAKHCSIQWYRIRTQFSAEWWVVSAHDSHVATRGERRKADEISHFTYGNDCLL